MSWQCLHALTHDLLNLHDFLAFVLKQKKQLCTQSGTSFHLWIYHLNSSKLAGGFFTRYINFFLESLHISWVYYYLEQLARFSISCKPELTNTNLMAINKYKFPWTLRTELSLQVIQDTAPQRVSSFAALIYYCFGAFLELTSLNLKVFSYDILVDKNK